MYLGRPDIGRPWITAGFIRVEDDTGLGIIPIVRQGLAPSEGDVVVCGVGEEIPLLAIDGVLGNPGVADILGKDGVVEGSIGGLVGAHGGGVPSLGAGLVRVEGLTMDQ